jgi:hypothetical protein
MDVDFDKYMKRHFDEFSDVVALKLFNMLTGGFQSNTIKIVISQTERQKKGRVGEVKAFQWTEEEIKIDKLYTILVKDGIVKGGDLMNFKKAFSGSVVNEDGHLITWLPWSNGGPNKMELFYFLYVLGNKKLITTVIPNGKSAAELYGKIRRIFAGVNGESINIGLKQSFQDFNNNRKKKLPAKVYKDFEETKPRKVVKDFARAMLKEFQGGQHDTAKSLDELKHILHEPLNEYENKYEQIVQKVKSAT